MCAPAQRSMASVARYAACREHPGQHRRHIRPSTNMCRQVWRLKGNGICGALHPLLLKPARSRPFVAKSKPHRLCDEVLEVPRPDPFPKGSLIEICFFPKHFGTGVLSQKDNMSTLQPKLSSRNPVEDVTTEFLDLVARHVTRKKRNCRWSGGEKMLSFIRESRCPDKEEEDEDEEEQEAGTNKTKQPNKHPCGRVAREKLATRVLSRQPCSPCATKRFTVVGVIVDASVRQRVPQEESKHSGLSCLFVERGNRGGREADCGFHCHGADGGCPCVSNEA